MSPLSTADAKHAAAIEKEIENIRGNLDGLVAELDHRRHHLRPSYLMHHHPSVFALAGLVVLAGLAGGGLLAYRARQRSRHSWSKRAQGVKGAVERLLAGKPIEAPPNVALKAAAAAAGAAGAVAGRLLAKRLLARA